LPVASVNTDMFNGSFKISMQTRLELFKEYGFDYIHWCEDIDNNYLYTRKDMKYYRELIDSIGLKCIDIHGSVGFGKIRIWAEEDKNLEKFIPIMKNRIEFCAAMGGDAVVIHPARETAGWDNNSIPDEQLKHRLNQSARVLDSVRPLCEDLGIVIAVENCYPSDDKILQFYFEKYPPKFVGFCFDSGHAHLRGNLERLLDFGDRLEALHLHDNRKEIDAHQPPFWGTINWEKVMRWIKESGYKKPINFEIMHNPEFFDGSMEEFLDYTRRMIRKALALFPSRWPSWIL